MRLPEFHYRWEWRLRSSPEQLWPLISDTSRFNRDVGLPAVQVGDDQARPNARRRVGFARFGLRVEWDEEPFEWVRPQRFGVVRSYRSGPVASLRVRADLAALPEGGTRLLYETWVRPSGLLGLLVVPATMTLFNRRAFAAAFRRYDDLTSGASPAGGKLGEARLAAGGSARLAPMQERLAAETGAADLAARLVELVAEGDEVTLARLRAYELAGAWGIPRRKVLEMCLQATRVGLLDLQWDLLCPLCRGAKESVSTLAKMKQQVHCQTCNIDFTANFERSVELTFRVSPAIREVSDASFCMGGPQMTPHIVAQQLLPAGERRDLELPLEEGRYRVRTLSLPGGQLLAATSDGPQTVTLAASPLGWPGEEFAVSSAPRLHLENATQVEQLFILERTAWSDQATTAADVLTLQAFRDLFSSELLRRGEHVSVGNMAILFTDLRDSTRLYREIGDAPAFSRVMDHFAVLREELGMEGGALVKTIGDAVMAVFRRPVEALRAVVRAQQRLASPPSGPPFYLRAGIHYGPCIAVTLNDRLDYFGSAVNLAARLEHFSSGEDIVISEIVRHDPEVAELLSSPDSPLLAEAFATRIRGYDEGEFPLWRVAPSTVAPGASVGVL